MLQLHRIHPGRERYYLETTASYSDRDAGLFEEEGRWLGTQANALGLDGDVHAHELTALFSGCDPSTGELLRAPTPSLRNAAIDCVFAAPKSISLLGALGAPDVVGAVHAAHAAAVDGAVDYLERGASRAQRGRGPNRTVVSCRGLCVAAFTHRSSRAPDPHLHTHALVMNLVLGSDGRWSTLDARELYYLGASAGALYDAALRAGISERLGCAFRARRGAIDLEGVPNSVIHAFSRRSRQISGELIDGFAPMLGKKDLSTSYEELLTSWRWRARGLGLSEASLDRVQGRVGPRPIAEQQRSVEAASVRTLASFRAPFFAESLLAHTASALVPGAQMPLLESTVARVLSNAGERIDTTARYGREGAIPFGRARPRYGPTQVPPPSLVRERVRERTRAYGELALAR